MYIYIYIYVYVISAALYVSYLRIKSSIFCFTIFIYVLHGYVHPLQIPSSVYKILISFIKKL